MRRVRIENGRERDSKTGKAAAPYKVLHLLYKDDHYTSLRPPPGSEDDKEDTDATTSTDAKQPQVRAAETALERPASATESTEQRALTDTVQSTARLANDTEDPPVAVMSPLLPLDAVRHAAFADDDDDASECVVVVSKPTRVVFQRGRPKRSASSASSTTSESPSSEGDSSSNTAPCPTADAVESPTDSSKATSDDADAVEEDAPRIAFPRRLKFHRGTPWHLTAAC